MPTTLYLARWFVKTTATFALVVLVTAFQINPVTAPAPDADAPLVAYAILINPTPAPALTAAPTATATATPSPTETLAPTLAPVEPTVSEPPPPVETPDALVPIKMPAVIAPPVPPVAAPLPQPASGGQPGVVRVPILMYHYISDPPPGSDSLRYSLSVTPANFDAQMNYLKQAGYQTITLYDLCDHLTQGKPLPARPIILTFDDGYVDAFQFALPILQKYGFVGTFFILTGPAERLGEGAYLNWAQIRAMSDAGMDMELHSREHVDLRNRPNDFLVHQIAGAKEALGGHTGRPVRWFAYPSGRYDAAVVRMLQSAGFLGSVTTIAGQTHTAAGLFDLQRVRIFGSETLAGFKKTIAGNP